MIEFDKKTSKPVLELTRECESILRNRFCGLYRLGWTRNLFVAYNAKYWSAGDYPSSLAIWDGRFCRAAFHGHNFEFKK